MRKRTRLPTSYRPSETEEFMNPRQLEYFRQKLLSWRAELLADSTGTLQHLKEESLLKPDLTDRASLETERAIELRTRDRERKLISKIDAAQDDAGRVAFEVAGDEFFHRALFDPITQSQGLLLALIRRRP